MSKTKKELKAEKAQLDKIANEKAKKQADAKTAKKLTDENVKLKKQLSDAKTANEKLTVKLGGIAGISSSKLTDIDSVRNALSSLGEPFKESDNLKTLKAKHEVAVAKKVAVDMLKRAQELDEMFNSSDSTQRDAILASLPAGVSEYIQQNIDVYSAQPATDLPKSEILKNLPVRVVEQMVVELSVDYPFTGMYGIEQVKNGLKQLFYKDYRDTDNKSGFSDVEIGDYNNGIEPTFTEVYQVDTEIHKGWDILDSMLADTFTTVGMFAVLINDYANAIARPFAKKMYQRVVSFLDTTASYDEVITFTAPTGNPTDEEKIRAKAKELDAWFTKIGTPSRKHLKKLPTGATQGLETTIKPTSLIMYVNSAFSASYNFDLIANTFQLNGISLTVKLIEKIDFETTAEYATVDNVLKDFEVVFAQEGVYQTIEHYDGSKINDVPKLKTVFNRFTRIGEIRRKDKLLVAFKSA